MSVKNMKKCINPFLKNIDVNSLNWTIVWEDPPYFSITSDSGVFKEKTWYKIVTRDHNLFLFLNNKIVVLRLFFILKIKTLLVQRDVCTLVRCKYMFY